MHVVPPAPRRSQSCWTCKARKIGCDRASPACGNCVRTGRKCLGYGFRLAWPDRPDGRRKPINQISYDAVPALAVDPAVYGTQFLNVTYTDVLALRNDGISAAALSYHLSRQRPCHTLPLFLDAHEKESHLLQYYTNHLSRMVSTIDNENGFRDVLLPIALTNSSLASNGLLNAVLALAAFHLWGSKEALSYKVNAIQCLSSSLTLGQYGSIEAQMAASMMLCVYNVFDEHEGDWVVHLNGAANMLQNFVLGRNGQVDQKFLCAWFLYHEVLGAFSQPLHQGQSGPVALLFLRRLDFDMSLIIGSLGCSVEVMEVIAYANRMRAMQVRGEVALLTKDEHDVCVREWKTVRRKVMSLKQTLDASSEASLSQKERTRILATAELYRLAALIYLLKTSLKGSTDSHRSIYLEQAIQVLRSLDTCTSPWPLFVIACELVSDGQRIGILQALDKMDERRNIGNVFVLRSIIESFWKQLDLRADSGSPGELNWWDVVELQTASPWFI